MSKEENVVVENTEAKNEAVNQPIVNTDAAKAKANEVASKAKEGFGSFSNKLKTDKKFLTMVVAIVGAVLLLVLGGAFYFNGGSKGAVKGFAKAFVKADAKKVVKYMNEDYLEASEDAGFDIEDSLDEAFDDNEDKDFKYLSYEIVDSDKLDKDDVEEVAEQLEENCDIDEDTVKAAVVYTIKFKVDDDGDKDTEKKEVTAVKIKGKWYIFLGDLS